MNIPLCILFIMFFEIFSFGLRVKHQNLRSFQTIISKKYSSSIHIPEVIQMNQTESAHEHFMKLAIRQAQFAFREKEVPIGRVYLVNLIQ